MPRGRKPLPDNIHLLNGNLGKIRAKTLSPRKNSSGIGEPPAVFCDEAKQIWAYAVELLETNGLIQHIDRMALENFCQVYVMKRQAERALEEYAANGESRLTYQSMGTNGAVMLRQRPEVQIISDSDRRLRAWLTEMGGTPVSRIKLPRFDNDKHQDPAEAYFA